MCIFRRRKKNEDENAMSNAEAVKLLFHIGNNISKIAAEEEDVEIYLQAIEKAISALSE